MIENMMMKVMMIMKNSGDSKRKQRPWNRWARHFPPVITIYNKNTIIIHHQDQQGWLSAYLSIGDDDQHDKDEHHFKKDHLCYSKDDHHHDKDDDEDMSISVNPGIEYAYSRPATSLANPSRDQVKNWWWW